MILSPISRSMANGKNNRGVKSGGLQIMKEGVKTRRAEPDDGEQAAEQRRGKPWGHG